MPRYHSRLLRLTPVSTHDHSNPVLIGSNFHLTTGAAEIKELADSKGCVVKLVPGAGALEGRLYFHSPRLLAVAGSEGCETFVVDAGNRIQAVVVSARRKDGAQSIALRFADQPPRSLAVVSDKPIQGRILRQSGFTMPGSREQP